MGGNSTCDEASAPSQVETATSGEAQVEAEAETDEEQGFPTTAAAAASAASSAPAPAPARSSSMSKEEHTRTAPDDSAATTSISNTQEERPTATSSTSSSGFAPQQRRRRRPSAETVPGAYRITPGSAPTSTTATTDNDNSSGAEADGRTHNTDGATATDSSGGGGGGAMERRLSNMSFHSVTAYVVEEDEPDGTGSRRRSLEGTVTTDAIAEAKVVPTICGVDRKRFVVIMVAVLVLLAVVLGAVLGILLPKSGSAASAPCGPLCPLEEELVEPDRIVWGKSCDEWNQESEELPAPEGADDDESCSKAFGAAAYACGCREVDRVDPPPDGCGSLCFDSVESIPDPEQMVTDINNIRLSCRDWMLKAQFDSDPNECPNYNAVGVLCGCQSNEPLPDACGPLCGESHSDFEFPNVQVYDQPCEEWDVFSAFLPLSYGNHGESCDERYRDVARRCECPGAALPPAVCGSLCQERSRCGSLCADGSAIPDPDLVVREMSCLRWEFRSRMDSWEGQDELCNFHHMVGAECGCTANEPPEQTCGPLCGPGTSVPYPDRQVQGHRCDQWDSTTTYLYEGYGLAMGASSSKIPSCEEFMALKAYGCGCPSSPEPPPEACGSLCKDGSSVPFPQRVIGDRTCADLDLLSRFDTDSSRCTFLRDIVGPQCGCKEDTDLDGESSCFTIGTIESSKQKYPYFLGQNTFTVSFGAGGKFLQTQNFLFEILIGDYFGLGNRNASSNVASYGGGSPCGMYGPRRGTVVLVEDPSVTEPYISNVIEPSICYYQAEMKIPTSCR